VVVVVFISGARGDSGSDFSNNLFSDLAPILAIFGEQFAKQFMSQSMSWVENIIFAMAPLGILTAIVGAIRVGGPSWLKTVVGRAREPQGFAELELMSSTSHEVCELWNGEAIVRVMGSPLVQELFYVKELDDSDKAETSQYASQADANHDEERITLPPSDTLRPEMTSSKRTKDAPNISLNLNSKKRTWELYLAALFGVLIQLAVLVVAGLGSYYPHWKLIKGGLPVKGYAYPLTAVGTMVLVAGMFVCASIVEQTTDEDEWVISMPGKKLDAHILWQQRSRTVNDQFFDSYAVINRNYCHGILTSCQTTPNNPTALFEAATVFGTIISICGFAAQFIGLRGMHWSASIAQLIATFLMTVVRAIVRRGLAERPHAERVP
ncbi:hypothetical protein BDD12DRAFT_696580, partial [Trichophaea hybrida]